jgi:predicted GNAT superfamily acetyltransferase
VFSTPADRELLRALKEEGDLVLRAFKEEGDLVVGLLRDVVLA